MGTVGASYWLGWTLARRGEHERAWEVIQDADAAGTKILQPFRDAVMADFLAVTERWQDISAFTNESRAYASDAQLRALPLYLDRLEGRASLAGGDVETGLESLERARSGFAGLGATWERARTELDKADALVRAGRTDDAAELVQAAGSDIERVGALIELERLRSLREQLG